MTWLRGAWREFIGLFVDDVGFAVAIVVWLAVVGAIARLSLVPSSWRGPLLFFGLAAIFVESTLRRARR